MNSGKQQEKDPAGNPGLFTIIIESSLPVQPVIFYKPVHLDAAADAVMKLPLSFK